MNLRFCLSRYSVLIPIFLLIAFALVVLLNAWVTDDAYITLKTVYNFTHGFGLRFNIVERVQSYTHPLWMFLLSGLYIITNEGYLTTLALSTIVSIAAVAVVVFMAGRTTIQAVIAVLLVVLSKAFIDFSTSGLENPLSHLLIALFFIVFLQKEHNLRTFFWLSLIACLSMLNRLDTALFYFPVLVVLVVKIRSFKVIPAGLLAFSPLIIWELFSLIYYGFLFPNTAYAKLNNRIVSLDLLQHGLWYFQNSWQEDPVTLLITGMGILLALFLRPKASWPLVAGMVLYLLYVLKIGGDFMSGRFFTVTFFASIVLLSSLPLKRWHMALFLVPVVLGFFNPYNPLYNRKDYRADDELWRMIYTREGIMDERGFYYPNTGLLLYPNEAAWVEKTLNDHDRKSVVDTFLITGTIGFPGYAYGPSMHIVDNIGLSEPLLARLPPLYQPVWRPGHFAREIPEGYPETIKTGSIQINDPDLALYYEKLRLVIQGPLFDKERLQTLINFNLGKYDHLINVEKYWRGPVQQVHYPAELDEPKQEGVLWQAPGNVIIDPDKGTEIIFPETVTADSIFASVDNNDYYFFEFYNNGESKGVVQIDPAENFEMKGLRTTYFEVPIEAKKGFNKVKIIASSKDKKFSLGHFILDN